MKKSILFLSLMLWVVALNFVPVATFAEDNISTILDKAAGSQGAGYATDAKLAKTGLATVVGNVARAFISFLGVIFISYTIYGGWIWMTAGGNEEKISKAKKILRDGIIGIVVVLSAAGIYLLVRDIALFQSTNGGTTMTGAG